MDFRGRNVYLLQCGGGGRGGERTCALRRAYFGHRALFNPNLCQISNSNRFSIF